MLLVISLIVLILSCLGVIVTVVLQEGKSAGLAGAIAGGAEQLLGRKKARGLDSLLHRLTIVFGVLFFLSAILVGYFL